MKAWIPLCTVILLLVSACTPPTKVEYIENQTLQYENLAPVELASDTMFEQKEIEIFVEDYLQSQPALLLKYAKAIVICGEKHYKAFGKSNTSVAFANPNNMFIYTKLDVSKNTLTHELAHIYDYAFGYHSISESNEFRQLYERYKGTFHFYVDKEKKYEEKELDKYDVYFNEDINEFFAECVQLYYNNPTYLEKHCKEIKEYFERTLIA